MRCGNAPSRDRLGACGGVPFLVIAARRGFADPRRVLWYTTWMRITASARRHGISDEAIRHAVANAIRVVDTDDGLFIIGVDAAARLLELLAREDDTR